MGWSLRRLRSYHPGGIQGAAGGDILQQILSKCCGAASFK